MENKDQQTVTLPAITWKEILIKNDALKQENRQLIELAEAMSKSAIEDSTGLWLLKPYQDWISFRREKNYQINP